MSESPARGKRMYNRMSVLRYEAGVSRAEVAETVGVSPTTIANIERRGFEPSLMLAWRISEYFGLPAEVIFSEEPLPTLSESLSRCGHGHELGGHEHTGCCSGEGRPQRGEGGGDGQ